MKKKILLLFVLASSLFLFGCGKRSEKEVLKDLTKKIDGVKGYELVGELEIVNNEDTYLYDVNVAYQKPDLFRVSLKNKTNNHEQIILKNTEGVYVLTPSLNKSFKFQSEWPYNNSQAYLLQTILKDIKSDKDGVMKETEDGYLFTSKVNFSSNPDLVNQNVYFDKDLNLKEVKIVNKENQVQMSLKVNKLDMRATFKDSYFTLKENMAMSDIDTASPVSTIEDIIYPMYIPVNTHLESQEKVTKLNGERIIETFGGEKPFTFVQETVAKEENLLTIPMYGEPYLVGGTIGALSDTSVSWIYNGIEYYVVSDVLGEEELLSVANSISVIPVSK